MLDTAIKLVRSREHCSFMSRSPAREREDAHLKMLQCQSLRNRSQKNPKTQRKFSTRRRNKQTLNKKLPGKTSFSKWELPDYLGKAKCSNLTPASISTSLVKKDCQTNPALSSKLNKKLSLWSWRHRLFHATEVSQSPSTSLCLFPSSFNRPREPAFQEIRVPRTGN